MEPEAVIEEVKRSARGRGGAGFLQESNGRLPKRPAVKRNISFAMQMRDPGAYMRPERDGERSPHTT